MITRRNLFLGSAGLSAKLPDLSGNGGKMVAINSGASALEAITTTGTGSGVRATSPTLATPTLGVASATTINKVTITAPATGTTLALADGGTFATVGAYAATMTITGATGVTFPTSGTLATLGNFSASGGAALVGTQNTQAPAYLKTVSEILNGDVVMIDRFLPSAKMAAIRARTSTYDVAADLNAALPYFTVGGGILAGPGRYYTTQPVVFGTNSKKIRFSTDGGATLYCAHTGHGIDLTAQDENYGGHILEGWTIQGPNVAYPMNAAELAGMSLGAGINVHDETTSNAAAGYNLILRDVTVQQFKYGKRLRAVMLGKYHNFIAQFNQYGVFVDGGQANANDWFAPSIRLNRVAGVYSTGATGGALTYATQNRIYGGIVESNIPYRGDNPAGYAGGFRTARDLTLAAGGHGVVLLNSYDWKLDGTYFENQNIDVWLGDSSDSNDFVFTRHGNGGNGRVGGFMFAGAGIANNKVLGSAAIGGSATDINVITDCASQNGNQFLDTEGFNFIPTNLVSYPYIRNNALNQGGGGTAYGAPTMPPQGYVENVPEGTTGGTITGIGTPAATLNAFGVGEVQLATLITANTAIKAIAGGRPGQTLVIRNYQIARTVKIISGTADTDVLLLKNKRSVRLTKYGQELELYCNGQGKWIEKGRNFSDRVFGYAQITGASTTVAVAFATATPNVYENEPDKNYVPLVSVSDATGAPAAGAWSMRAHNQTTAGFSISVQTAPGGATGLYYTWEAVR